MNTDIITTNISENNLLTGIIILLIGVLIYLFFFKEDQVNVIEDTPENTPEDAYTVSVGNPKLITRCKPLPPINKAEIIDFGFKPAYTPNSRGNVCEKGKVDDNVLFPSLTNEKVLDNVNADGETIIPVSSFTGDEAPFAANCTFTKPDCSNQQTTLFPGEILIKESIPVGETEAPSDTVESFSNYYEGFIENTQCGNHKKTVEKYDNYEGFVEEYSDTATLTFYGADWCGHCQKAKPGWDAFKRNNEGKEINGKKVNCVYEECGDGKNEKCEQAGVKGFPTFKLDKNDGEGEKEINVKERTEDGFLSTLKSLL